MSLEQINNYSVGDVNLTSLMETLDRQRRGYQALSLTHYDDDLECEIAAGSIVEVGGGLFKTEADEPITGWVGIGNDEDVYVKLVPSGTMATATFVTAAPTWSTSKQGWYVGNDRYIGGLRKDGSGNYTRKHLFRGLWQKLSLLSTGIKIGTNSRSSSGNQVITGLGFRPSVVIFIATDADTDLRNNSWGFDDGSTALAISVSDDGMKGDLVGDISVYIKRDVANYIYGHIASIEADGFTIIWILVETVEAHFIYLALP